MTTPKEAVSAAPIPQGELSHGYTVERHAREMVGGHFPKHREYLVAAAYLEQAAALAASEARATRLQALLDERIELTGAAIIRAEATEQSLAEAIKRLEPVEVCEHALDAADCENHSKTPEARMAYEKAADLYCYDPETGKITYRRQSGRAQPGDEAGTVDERGYRRLAYRMRSYPSHRMAWLLHYGHEAPNEIDHINGIRDDNRIANLRLCNRSENQQNRLVIPGITGTAWHERRRKWEAFIMLDQRQHTLGYFDSRDEAHAAYVGAKKVLHRFQPTPRTTGALYESRSKKGETS